MSFETLSVATTVVPTTTPPMATEENQPISRTYQYRKVMKPMLERKRRARINRCLDELKELMVTALQSEGENVSKLEKADILELTVRHLHKLRRQQRLAANPIIDADRFRAGFTHCANEVSRCLAATPGVDIQLGTQLMTHLGHRLNEMDKKSPLRVQISGNLYTPPGTPGPIDNSTSNNNSYTMPLTPASSTSSRGYAPSSPVTTPMDYSNTSVIANTGLLKIVNQKIVSEKVWRPW